MLSLTVIRDSLDLWTPTVEHILRMQLSFVQQVRMLKMYLYSFFILVITFIVCPDHQYQCECGRLDGQQPPCIATDQRCDGTIDCIGGEDELDHNCPCGHEGAVRLVDGIVSHRGRVEFCVSGRWSGICATQWDNADAAVVCRQLGYPSEGIYISGFIHFIMTVHTL